MLGLEALADADTLEALLRCHRLVAVQVFSSGNGRWARPAELLMRRLLESVRRLELCVHCVIGQVAIDAVSHVLTRLLHTLVVLMPVLVGNASRQFGVSGLRPWSSLVPVLICSIEVRVRAAEFQELVAAENLLHLLMIYFV